MTKVTFFKRGGVYYGFEETGHAGYAEAGNDILCSALSAMTMLIVNTVEISFATKVDYEIDESATRITVKCPAAIEASSQSGSGIEDSKRYAIAGLFQGYFYQLTDLSAEYYDHLEVDEKEV